MASQPANTTIEVFRKVRAQRQELRHEADKALTGKMRALVMVVPSEEILVSQTRDAVVSDAWRFGHPVVRYLKAVTAVSTIVDGVSNLEFPIQIGRDKFLTKTTGNNTDDLHGDVRTAAGFGTAPVVVM